jgi:alpha-D-xyloside xylohydrolase
MRAAPSCRWARSATSTTPDAPLEIHIYPGRDSAFRLYDDEGDGYGYEDGAFAVVDLSWDDATRRLSFGERRGEFPGMRHEQDLVLILHTGADAPGLDRDSGRGVETRYLRYAGETMSVQW